MITFILLLVTETVIQCKPITSELEDDLIIKPRIDDINQDPCNNQTIYKPQGAIIDLTTTIRPSSYKLMLYEPRDMEILTIRSVIMFYDAEFKQQIAKRELQFVKVAISTMNMLLRNKFPDK